MAGFSFQLPRVWFLCLNFRGSVCRALGSVACERANRYQCATAFARRLVVAFFQRSRTRREEEIFGLFELSAKSADSERERERERESCLGEFTESERSACPWLSRGVHLERTGELQCQVLLQMIICR